MKLTIELEVDLKKSGINELYFYENKDEIVENLIQNGAEEELLHCTVLGYEYGVEKDELRQI